MKDLNKLEQIAKDIRRKVFQSLYKAEAGLFASCFSIVELMTVIYFSGIFDFHCEDLDCADRDHFILSKGHAGPVLYTVANIAGMIPDDQYNLFCTPSSKLGIALTRIPQYGSEAATGSLGHGFCFAGGIAMAGKIDGLAYKTICIIGDGECQEGSIWEAALFNSHQKLNNLIAIIDYNKLQGIDKLDNIISMGDMAQKWISFGWKVIEINGHDLYEIHDALNMIAKKEDGPYMIIAHTTKGKGLSFMENDPTWHNRLMNDKEFKLALKELDIKEIGG